MFSCLNKVILFSVLIATTALPAYGKVEAVRGKSYPLDAQHGPWMIMVAALKDVPPERRTKGMSSQEAANELVYELRKKGIPSYTFRFNNSTAVLAGNFESSKQELAQRVLTFIKNYVPEFMKDKRNGGLFKLTPGRPKPLSGAMLTVNPKSNANDVRSRTLDPLVKKLNADDEFSLLRNRGKYSLRIATFEGSSITQLSGKTSEKAQSFFEKQFGSSLDASGQKAWELCHALRQATKYGYDRNYEAWVFHDRNKSYVAVGSFQSPNDPEIVELAKRFSPKPKVHEGRDVTYAETVAIPRYVPEGSQPERLWVLDMKPTLTKIPGR